MLAIERVELAEPELVYNFTVKGPHTYFVLEVGVLVHNCRPRWDKNVKRWRDPETGRFAKRPESIKTFEVDGFEIHQYKEDSFWRAVVIDDEVVDKSITKHGYQAGYERGVGKPPSNPLEPEDATKLAPDAPHQERVVEYIGIKGQKGFPRDANVVGVHSDPTISVGVAKGTGIGKVEKSGAYIRVDELDISREEVIDVEILFDTSKLEPKFPVKYEFNWDGSIPANRIINTTRLPLGGK